MSAPHPQSAAPFRAALGLGFVVFALALPLCNATAAPPPFRLPQPVIRTLPNGLTVAVFRDTRLPLAQLQLTVPAGSATEGSLPAGVAYVTSQLVGQSTASRDAGALQEDLERAGGHMATRIGRDVGILSGTFLAAELPLALELMADASTHALFTDDDFARVSRGVRALASGPAGIARQPEDGLWGTAFGGRGYGSAPAGTAESLDRMTIADVRTFYNSRWGPAGAVLAVAGDVQPDSVMAWVDGAFGTWSARAVEPGATATPAAAARGMKLVNRKDATQCEVWVGVPGPRVGDPDEIPIALASQLVAHSAAGTPGLRVGQSALRYGGFVWLSASARVDSAVIVARKLESAFSSLRGAPPKAADLEPLKQAIVGSFPMRFESLEGLADQWSAEAALGLGFDNLTSFPARVAAVTGAQVAAAARKWFDPARMTFVIAGPSERLQGPAAAIAPLVLSGSTDEPVTPALEKLGRERIARAVAAHGSLALLKKVKDSVIEASSTMRMGKTEVTATIVQMRKEPGRMIYDLKIHDGGTRDVLVGNRAWSSPIDTLNLVHEADSTTVATLQQGFRSDVVHLLLDAADPRTRLAARGTTQLNGQTLERVEVWTALGSHRIMFLDPLTHLLSGIETQESGARSGSTAVRRWYHDYRAVNGVRLPFDEERWMGTQRVMHMKLTRYALNAGVADELFVHPETPLPPTSR